MPSLMIEGEIYPASKLARVLSNIVFILRFVVVGFIIGGPASLENLGITSRPQWFMWMCENKLSSVLLVIIVGSQIEQQLLSTGAFEVFINGDLKWSKLESGRLPSLIELKQLVTEFNPNVIAFDPQQTSFVA